MAKRTNQNPRNKKPDPSDDQTIIKIKSTKTEKRTPAPRKPRAPRKPKTENQNTPEKTTSRPSSKSVSKNSTSSRSSKSNNQKTKSSTSKSTKSETNKRSQNSNTDKSTNEQNKTNSSSSSSSSKSSTPTSVPTNDVVKISQTVGILIDGNNIEMSLTKLTNNKSAVLNYDTVIPKLLNGRGLNRLIYFREGRSISQKLADRLHTHYFGSVVPCHKSADIPLSINATQLADKVDTIIILSGDSDYVELVRHLKYRGVRVEIAAIEITTASILKDEADYYHTITKEDAFILK